MSPVLKSRETLHATARAYAPLPPSPPVAQTIPAASPQIDPLNYMAFADQAILLGSGMLCYVMLIRSVQLPLPLMIAMVAGATAFALTAYSRRLYSYARMENIVRQLMPFAFAFFQCIVAASAVLFLLHQPFALEHEWLSIWCAISLTGMGLLRGNFWHALEHRRRLGLYARKAVLVGASEKAELMIRHFVEHGGYYHITGLLVTDDNHAPDRLKNIIPQGSQQISLLSSVEELTHLCRDQRVDDIVITPELEAHPEAESILKALEDLPCSIKYCIPGNFFSRPLANVELISHIPVVTIFQTPLRGTSLLIKRAEDVIISSLAIFITAPIMALAALLVALDGQGQILFRQKRHGFGGREFDIYKFRSLRVEPMLEDELPQVTRNDGRVTWIGKFLRKTSIDELPQLFNVLKGDMSIVGPRPHAVVHNYHYKELINGYVARQRIKPGITGWAQINGWRGQTDTLEKMRKRVEHDLYYVENWSLWFDIKIIILTAVTFLRHQNAY